MNNFIINDVFEYRSVSNFDCTMSLTFVTVHSPFEVISFPFIYRFMLIRYLDDRLFVGQFR